MSKGFNMFFNLTFKQLTKCVDIFSFGGATRASCRALHYKQRQNGGLMLSQTPVQPNGRLALHDRLHLLFVPIPHPNPADTGGVLKFQYP
jgi:hypothetical protein